jgi:4'-phosphopantetheinyl transferase
MVRVAPAPTAALPPLDPDAVHVWLLPDNADGEHLLAADELARIGRFRRDVDRRRFIARRAGLRRVLAAYLDVDARHVVIERSCQRCGDADHGRPRLRSDADLSFNTASRPGLAVVAVAAASMSIGIDIERLADVDLDALRRTALTQDELTDGAGESLAEAARLWCRKEAVLKAEGLGLGGAPPSSLDVRGPTAGPWHLTDLVPAAGWLGAIATSGRVNRVHLAHWT